MSTAVSGGGSIVGSVRVLPHFFASVMKDYSDWVSALVGELLQNSRDCGSNEIHFTTRELEDGSVELRCCNNGKPMTKDELFGKLLALGGTTKDAVATTGGFGRAKELLYFSQQCYTIRSGSYVVDGVGSEYSGQVLDSYIKGTESIIKLSKTPSGYSTVSEKLVKEKLIALCLGSTLKGVRVTYNDIDLEQLTSKRYKVSETEAYEVCRTKSNWLSGWVLVRHKGLLLFKQYVSNMKVCILLELKKPCTEVLLTSRCGFRSPWDNAFHSTVANFVLDKLSSHDSDYVRPISWSAGKLFSVIKTVLKEAEPLGDSGLDINNADSTESEEQGTAVVKSDTMSQIVVPEPSPISEAELQKFKDNRTPASHVLQLTDAYSVFVSGVGRKLPPARYWKQGKVSSSVIVLLTRWARLIELFHEVAGYNGNFAVGLTFANKTEAAHKAADDYNIFFVGPMRGSVARFKASDQWQLPAIAAHEFTHKFVKFHDEEFASLQTDHSAFLTKYSKRINSILRSNEKLKFGFPLTIAGS